MFGFKKNRLACIALAVLGGAFTQGFSQDLLYPDMFALGDVLLLDCPLK